MTDRVEIDTSGLMRMIGRMRARVDPIGRKACADTAEQVAGTTRGAVPVRSGRLAGSVRVAQEPAGARVEMGAPYAGWIEYGGTRGRPYVAAGRYLGPASKDADRKIVAQAERDIQRGAVTW
jgi:hypothetical protein